MSANRLGATTFFLLFILATSLSASEKTVKEHPKFKVGTINLAVAASLHPKMALFDFQKMGFYRVPLGLAYEEYSRVIGEFKAKKPDKSIQEKISKIDEQLRIAGSSVREIINEQKTNNPERMSSDVATAYLRHHHEITELNWQRKELSFSISNPEFTSPAETREILQKIEKEIIASVKEVAEKECFSIILNTSVPAASGYPTKYHLGARFSTGPVGIDQTLFYGFLAEKRVSSDIFAYTEDYLRKWISITGRPEAVEMLPMKPYPLVLEGGECVLTQVIEKIYHDHKIDQEITDQLKQILLKLEIK